jgi:hypothetical protein
MIFYASKVGFREIAIGIPSLNTFFLIIGRLSIWHHAMAANLCSVGIKPK